MEMGQSHLLRRCQVLPADAWLLAAVQHDWCGRRLLACQALAMFAVIRRWSHVGRSVGAPSDDTGSHPRTRAAIAGLRLHAAAGRRPARCCPVLARAWTDGLMVVPSVSVRRADCCVREHIINCMKCARC